MKVAALREHLAGLGNLLGSAGGSAKVVADLGAVSEGLAAFAELELVQFVDFLKRAHAYQLGGEVPVAKGKSPAPKAPAPSVEKIAEEIRHLYERSGDPAVTVEQIEEALIRLSGLTKDGLVVVAEGIDLRGMKAKSKTEIINTMRQRILARKGASQRAGLLDRPAGSPPMAVPVAP